MVLSEGRVAYLGEREGLVPFFSKLNFICPQNYNPSDYVMQIMSVIPGKEEKCKQRVSSYLLILPVVSSNCTIPIVD